MARKPKPKDLGSGLAERAGKRLRDRGRDIDDQVDKAQGKRKKSK